MRVRGVRRLRRVRSVRRVLRVLPAHAVSGVTPRARATMNLVPNVYNICICMMETLT